MMSVKNPINSTAISNLLRQFGTKIYKKKEKEKGFIFFC